MELVEGPTVGERIARGPIALGESLDIAAQIAEGMAAAHDRGIIHRDLKPANVKLTTTGAVKVLDFGIARAVDAGGEAPGTAVMTMPATEAGVIVGTASYMSPEQACGKAVDHRTDIWAFGCLLYEMLTVARPVVLWSGRYSHGMSTSCGPPGPTSSNYDVNADGTRFLMVEDSAQGVVAHEIHVVVNWAHQLGTIATSRRK